MEDILPAQRSLEDEILFEKIKALPKRSHYYSVHRQLSWQCEREVKQFEKDTKLVTSELTRSQTSLQERLRKLREKRMSLIKSGEHSEVLLRGMKIPKVKSLPWNLDKYDNSKSITELKEEKVDKPETDVIDADEDEDETMYETITIRREQTTDLGDVTGGDSPTAISPRQVKTAIHNRRFTVPIVTVNKQTIAGEGPR